MKRHLSICWPFYALLSPCLIVVFGIGLAVADSFNRSVEVTDGNGTLRAVMFAVDGNNKSGLELKDPNGAVKFSIHTNGNNDPFINLFDKNGNNRIELGIAPNGDSYLLLRRGNGTIVHSFVAPL